jgi:hypothetical protein
MRQRALFHSSSAKVKSSCALSRVHRRQSRFGSPAISRKDARYTHLQQWPNSGVVSVSRPTSVDPGYSPRHPTHSLEWVQIHGGHREGQAASIISVKTL